MKLKNLKTQAVYANPITVAVVHPSTGLPIGVEIDVYGDGSAQAQAAQDTVARESLALMQKATPAPQSYPAPPAYQPLHVSEPSPPSYAPPIDASISESIQLFRQLTTTQRAEVLAHMQRLLSARAANPASTTPRSDHPQSSQPAPKTFYKLSACN